MIGTIAVTSGYRHRTIGTTFPTVPQRGRVLAAKLAVHGAVGLAYGTVFSVAAGAALTVGAAARGVRLGVGMGDLVPALVQPAVASAVCMVNGVGFGALARFKILATGITLGYVYVLEYLLLIVPGVSAVYALLPGNATAGLTRFTFLTATIAAQMGHEAAPLLPVWTAALVLLAYAVTAVTVAITIPMRRDLR